MKPVPSRNTHPNWRLQLLLKHAIMLSKSEMVLVKGLTRDEEKICFKGRHTDILRISYKKEGGGFQCDALCSDGYTFIFYFRNQLDPKCFIDKGMLPLHVICMALLEQVSSFPHSVGVENLYISAKFIR